MKWLRRILYLILLLIALLAAVLFFAPWQQWVGSKLIAAIEGKGLSPVALTVDSLRTDGVRVTGVSIGEPPVKLDALTVGYDLRALREGRIESVTLTGLRLAAVKEEKGEWRIDGLASLMGGEKKESESKLPFTRNELHDLPLGTLKLEESRLGVQMPNFYADIPLTLSADLKEAKASLESATISATMGKDSLAIEKLKADLALDEAKKEWRGTWEASEVVLTTEKLPLPALAGKGDITLSETAFKLTGALKNPDGTYAASFTFTQPLDGKAAMLAVREAHMPWSGGSVGLNNALVPLVDGKSIRLTLQVKDVAVDGVLKALTDEKSTGTGLVSGSVPLTIAPGGKFTIGKGSLKAIEPGVIALSPEAIPGDNAQVALVRDVMKNLHYSVLAMELDMAPDNTLVVKLAVEGKNPDVEGGRPIKLNVNLSGDLLNLLLANMQLMADPETFIKQSVQ